MGEKTENIKENGKQFYFKDRICQSFLLVKLKSVFIKVLTQRSPIGFYHIWFEVEFYFNSELLLILPSLLLVLCLLVYMVARKEIDCRNLFIME